MKLSIIIPTLNEANNVRTLLPTIRTVIKKVIPDPADYEILIVDAHSKDNIKEICRQNGARCISVPKGYGVALSNGIKNARGEYIITMDADFSHSPHIIPILYSHRDEADFLIASRYVKNGYSSTSLFRRFLSVVLNMTFRFVLDMHPKDLSSGFRLYNSRIFKEITPTEKNYVVLQEILIKSHAAGFQIKEVPFHYHPRKHGVSKSRLFTFGKEYLFTLFKFWKLRNSIECADYDERAFHSRMPLQRYWQRKRYHIICDYVKDFQKILDIGCGSSQILDGLPQSIGCDVRLNKLRYKRAPYRELFEASVYNLPFKDESFEAVIFSEVMEHLPPDREILDEVVRVTEKGGTIIVGTPDYATHWKTIEQLYQFFHPTGYADEHITHYTRKSLIKEMTARNCMYLEHKYILGAEIIVKFKKE